MIPIIAITYAYLLGSIPFAYISGRLFGRVDIRKHGTRNVGTLNVLEVLGVGEALFTLAGDMGKGMAAVFVAQYLGVNEAVIMLSAFAVVVGHNWPIWLKFHGGKGLATTMGVALALAHLELVLVGVMYGALFFFLKRHSPLSNVIAFLFLPLFSWYFGRSFIFILGFLAIALLRVLADYKSWYRDVVRLIAGKPHTPLKSLALLAPSLWEKKKNKN